MADRRLRVFLCHASQDKPLVRELYQRLLAEAWIDPWLDEEKLLPGQDWDFEIEKAVEITDVVIVCLSNQSSTKEGYIQRELRFALDIALEKPDGTIFIIPLKLENCEPPRKLRRPHYVEYFPPEQRDSTFQRLKRSLEIRAKSLEIEVASPEFPTLTESLSSRIIAKKLSDARQALQNDQLQVALGIYDVLVRQKLKLNEIIGDLEDVSIIYSDSKELWTILATASRMSGDLKRAQEYEDKIIPSPLTDVNENPELESHQEVMENTSASRQRDQKQQDFDWSRWPFALPSTISVETLGGVSTPLLYKGAILPAQKHEVFSTASDNQTQVEVHLVMGENKFASDNQSLGKFALDGIPPAPRGVPQIEILLEVSTELELKVAATDKATGRNKNFQAVNLNTITPPPIKDPLPPNTDTQSNDLDDLFGSTGGFSDFFKTIFGERTAEAAVPADPKGYQQPLEISIEEAYKGATRRLEIDGSQKLVHIPAGVRTGSKVRLAGAGPNGLDLYLIISVQPHPFFTQTGSDLLMQFPVTENLAKRGGDLRVPLIEKGKSMVVAIPANTKDKQTFRFANKGFPRVKNPAEFGDFYLTAVLYDPRKIPQEVRKLLDLINNHLQS